MSTDSKVNQAKINQDQVNEEAIADLGFKVSKTISEGSFVSLLFSKPVSDKGLIKAKARIVRLKDGDALSTDLTYSNRTETKNHSFYQFDEFFRSLVPDEFTSVRLCTTEKDWVFDTSRKGAHRLYSAPSTVKERPSTSHNSESSRLVPIDSEYLLALGITNREGDVRVKGGDKYRQIVKFIEIIDSLLPDNIGHTFRAFDLGCGKGYLTFALAQHLITKGGGHVVGVDRRDDLITSTNKTVLELHIKNLEFVAKDAAAVDVSGVDLLVALHACDTATDDVIIKAVVGKVSRIVLAPCCQKYVRSKVQSSKDLDGILKHGIHLERFCSMLTDSLRSLALEAVGYKSKVFEFISSEHTAKNIMITATLGGVDAKRRKEALEQYQQLKAKFGITEFVLDGVVEVK